MLLISNCANYLGHSRNVSWWWWWIALHTKMYLCIVLISMGGTLASIWVGGFGKFCENVNHSVRNIRELLSLPLNIFMICVHRRQIGENVNRWHLPSCIRQDRLLLFVHDNKYKFCRDHYGAAVTNNPFCCAEYHSSDRKKEYYII